MSHNSDMIKLLHFVESHYDFAGQSKGQIPGDQVRGKDKAVSKGTDHPFKGRLVGEETALEDILGKKYQDFKEIQAKKKKEKLKKESENIEMFEDFNDNPLVNAIAKRIMQQRPDLLRNGPEHVMAAINDVVDSIGDVEEIGTSDISNWVKEVERRININQNLTELGATMPEPPQGTATTGSTAGSSQAQSNISPNEKTALDKISKSPAMKQQLDQLLGQAHPEIKNNTNLSSLEQTALEKLKSNAGLKNQYDQLVKQANPGAAV
jgi:hypothetical protein